MKITIDIDFDILLKHNEYASKHGEKSLDLYDKRNDGFLSSNKLFKDNLYGKLAETAVSQYLESINIKHTKPDLSISSNHGYDTDLYLTDNKTHLHVKCYRQEYFLAWNKDKDFIIPPSCLFQKNDDLVCDPLPGHFIVPVFQHNLIEYEIFGYIPANKAVFNPPKRNMPSKIALYFSDNLKFKLNTCSVVL